MSAKIASTRSSSCAKARPTSSPPVACSRYCQARPLPSTAPTRSYATVRNGVGSDGFDTWAAGRDRRYYGRTANYVSPQMVGAADLDQYGTWSQVPEYGAVWYPSDVGADWAPYRNGYWTEVGAWGPTWVDYAPWGYAPFHYGRWAYIGGRWGWCPGAYVARPLWAPALVGWAGGSGWSLSATVGTPVYGWVPLGWGEPYRPWWGRCSNGCWNRYNRPYAVNVAVVRPNSPPTRYVNWNAPGGITAVSGSALVMRQPVQANLVRVPAGVAASAPVLASAPIRTQRAWAYSDAPCRGRRAAACFHVLSNHGAPGWRAWRHRRTTRRRLCRRGANGAHPAHRADDRATGILCATHAAICGAGRRAGLRRWRCNHCSPARHQAGATPANPAAVANTTGSFPAMRGEQRIEPRSEPDPTAMTDRPGRRRRHRRRGTAPQGSKAAAVAAGRLDAATPVVRGSPRARPAQMYPQPAPGAGSSAGSAGAGGADGPIGAQCAGRCAGPGRARRRRRHRQRPRKAAMRPAAASGAPPRSVPTAAGVSDRPVTASLGPSIETPGAARRFVGSRPRVQKSHKETQRRREVLSRISPRLCVSCEAFPISTLFPSARMRT